VKAVILAGGLGTRMGDETASRPKPLVEVGGRPIIWHILKIFQAHGISDFVVCSGFAGSLLSDYFARHPDQSWHVEVVDTGESTATGGRLKRVQPLLGSDPFCMTYGDGVANVNVRSLIDFHRGHGKLVTVTAVRPWLPFGVITFQADAVAVGFAEKPRLNDIWVNSGFFVIDPRALDLVRGDDQAWENGPMAELSQAGQLAAFKHEGYWQCMDTPKDRQALEQAWASGHAPWKVW